MNSKELRLLTRLVNQYKENHNGQEPEKIVVEPLALVALGIKKSVAPVWNGLKVECREIEKKDVAMPKEGTMLGVILDTARQQLVGCSLKKLPIVQRLA
jgi:hypothetical protein